MKKSILFILFVIFYSCKTIDCNDTKACNFYLEKYNRVENYCNKNFVDTIDNADIIFIVELTKIMPDYIEGIDIVYTPSRKNLKDWKKWYDKNKDMLYWDEIEQKVKLRK
jgi:hypothetical protein